MKHTTNIKEMSKEDVKFWEEKYYQFHRERTKEMTRTTNKDIEESQKLFKQLHNLT